MMQDIIAVKLSGTRKTKLMALKQRVTAKISGTSIEA
jgi:hypothetical protein